MVPTRIRIDRQGHLEIIDPGFQVVRLLRAIDPTFKVLHRPLPGFTSPRLLKVRSLGTGKSSGQLAQESEEALWELHGRILDRFEHYEEHILQSAEEASLLDLKAELARRLLSACRFCGHQCQVNRWEGERGKCQLGVDAKIVSHFVHIAEEAPINPSLNLQMAGCGLRCRYCQQGELLDPTAINAPCLDAELWPQIRLKGARSLTFIGGNPDESLYAILQFLKGAPASLQLPLVWNSHGYSSPVTLSLLEGLVDVFVPDLKYGDDACGRKLSDVKNYPVIAQEALKAMLTQKVPVILRLLVLPGHFDCCHAPVLDFLATLRSHSQLWGSIRGQYCPDWLINDSDGELNRRVSPEEVMAVQRRATELGLQLVETLQNDKGPG